jgi:hypothetical protein
VILDARRRVKGGGSIAVDGRVAPARAGVRVAVTVAPRRGTRRPRTHTARTHADGSYSLLVPVRESSTVRALAEGIGSQTRIVTVVSKVRIAIRNRPDGSALVKGRVRPALAGRVLLLRRGAVKPTAVARPRGGRFRIRLGDPRSGRYEAVFIPSARRAERSTSNTGVVR